MNAYKYQKFLEGLNNLRGMMRLLTPCPILAQFVNTYCVGCSVRSLNSHQLLKVPSYSELAIVSGVFRQ